MKIDGRAIARKIYSNLEIEITQLKGKRITPHLVVILIGNDPASKAYIRQKIKRGEEIGIKVTLKRFPRHTSERTVVQYISILNTDKKVHGIIVQRPLPPQFEIQKINSAVIPEKDVDGFHPERKFTPPLALAVLAVLNHIYKLSSRANARDLREISLGQWPIEMTQNFKLWLTSKNIVFIGRGEAGGRPVISHVDSLGIPHQIIHSKTENSKEILKNADIIVTAVGKENIVPSDKVKQGVILIGIGLHKGKDGKLKGDYDEEEIKKVASYYTPTPGGVGPVNVAMLLHNVILAAEQ